jgi:hypothetical protein
MPPYENRFTVGTRVRIASLIELDTFRRTWTYHNPLTSAQLAFAGGELVVVEIGFYHGGDPLYTLDGAPGVWHEACLSAASSHAGE